jgi:hypothetical protein
VFCVIVAEAPGAKPVTVKTLVDPLVELTVTTPLVTVAVSQVNAASKFVIETLNPSAVAVGDPKIGFRAEPEEEVAETVAEAPV